MILKLLRFVPGILGTGIMVATLWSLPFELSILGLYRVSLICVASSLISLSVALLLLSPSILTFFWRNWIRFSLHGVVFFATSISVVLFTKPDHTEFAGQLSLLIVLWLFSYRIVEYLIDSLIWQKRHRVKGLDIGHDRSEVSDSEYWTYCVHEAGHLLLYGLLSRLPEDAFAVVDRSPQYGFGGYVSLLAQVSDQSTRVSVMEWLAMTYYAGAAAEEIEFGSHCEGGKSDFAGAETAVRRLASMQPGEAYFPSPENDVERGINAETIRALRKRYFEAALAYLRANRTALINVAEHLRKNASMDCEEFYPLWSQATLPDGFAFIDPPEGVACLAASRQISD